jgi:hypothetical protein
MEKGNKIFVALILAWCVFMGIFIYGNMHKEKGAGPAKQGVATVLCQ